MTPSQEATRRRSILQAARWCFLNFGYSKTSLQDIAKRASISRTLLYRSFKNKEEIYGAVFEDWFEDRYPSAERASRGPGAKSARLMRVCEIMLLEPWAEMVGAPMAAEFYDVCARLAPDAEVAHQKKTLKFVQTILGDKEVAAVFLLALDGLCVDMPPAKSLKRRVELLVDGFAHCQGSGA